MTTDEVRLKRRKQQEKRGEEQGKHEGGIRGETTGRARDEESGEKERKKGRGKQMKRERMRQRSSRLEGQRVEGCTKEHRGVERDGGNDGWRDGEGERGRVGALMGRPLSFFICGFTTQ